MDKSGQNVTSGDSKTYRSNGDEDWLILAVDRSAGVALWWRPNERGYTTDLQFAGRYSRDHAERISRSCHGSAAAVPPDVAQSLTKRMVVDIGDGQNFKTLDAVIQSAKLIAAA